MLHLVAIYILSYLIHVFRYITGMAYLYLKEIHLMKQLVFFSLFYVLTLALNLTAAPISQEEAQNVAKNWMLEKSGQELEIDTSALGATGNKSDAYRIIKLKPKGWVIVSSDDVARPVIGYGFSQTSNGENPAFNEWMKGVENQINSVKNNLEPLSTEEKSKATIITNSWSKYKVSTDNFKNSNAFGATGVNDFDYIVRPLLWMGSAEDKEEQGIRWNQNPYENQACPIDSDGPNGHAYVGCVATVMGQLMRYYQFPTRGIGSHSYTPNTHPEYGEQFVDFSTATYDWANMPLYLTTNNLAVATALYHAGVAVDMNYGIDVDGGSSANITTNNGLKQFFGYELALEISRNNYSDTTWHTLLQEQLNTNHPVAYSGRGNGGHQFILDGFDADNFYHINWGWGGNENGKFVIDDLTLDNGRNYSFGQYLTIIQPHDTSPIVTINDENLKICVMEALDVNNPSDIKELKVKFMKRLECRDKNITDISSLIQFEGLDTLYLNNNNITDISALSNLTHLTGLSIKNNQIKDISALANLTNLSWMLDMAGNNISDLSPIQNLTQISWLNISYNKISDLSLLANFTNLNDLYLYGNYITDFSAVDSNVISGTDYQNTLLAPSNLMFSDVTKTSVTLHWNDNANNETGYKIFRNGVLINTVTSNSTSYMDTALTQNTSYTYTVKATLE
jgi:hypothetical protein